MVARPWLKTIANEIVIKSFQKNNSAMKIAIKKTHNHSIK